MPPSSYLAEKSYQSEFATISPGIEAIGCSLPSTLHSTSTPLTNSSTSTFSSCWNASSIPARSSCSLRAFEIPTDEPRRAGLTKTGKPNGFSKLSWLRRSVTLFVTGIPLSRSTDLNRSLSMHRRRRRHAGADVGHVRELEQPLHRPVLAERPMEHREDHVHAGERLRDARRRYGSVSAAERPSRSSSAREAEPSAQRPSRPISTVTAS